MAAATFIFQQAGLSATPLLVAGYGELVAERAGVINVSIEGTMLMGAVAAFGAACLCGTVGAAFPAAIAVGILMGGIFAIACVWLGADQIVAGTALNILAAGASITANRMLPRPRVEFYKTVDPGIFDGVPVVGPVVHQVIEAFAQYSLFYIALGLAVVLALVLRRTRAGLIIRALGDAPEACDAAGVSVRWSRTVLLLIAGGLSGAAGAYLSTMRVGDFVNNMTSGRGFLVLALVIFGRWRIGGLVLGVFAFSLLDGLQSWMTTSPAGQQVPRQLFDMLPYVATLLALTFLAKSRGGPIYLGRAWPE